jgi:hypothetical protein
LKGSKAKFVTGRTVTVESICRWQRPGIVKA